MISLFEKYPDEKVVFGLDWADELDGKAIQDSTFTVVEGDVNLSVPNVTGTQCHVRVTDGSADSVAVIKNVINLTNGERYEAHARMRVKALDS